MYFLKQNEMLFSIFHIAQLKIEKGHKISENYVTLFIFKNCKLSVNINISCNISSCNAPCLGRKLLCGYLTTGEIILLIHDFYFYVFLEKKGAMVSADSVHVIIKHLHIM